MVAIHEWFHPCTSWGLWRSMTLLSNFGLLSIKYNRCAILHTPEIVANSIETSSHSVSSMATKYDAWALAFAPSNTQGVQFCSSSLLVLLRPSHSARSMSNCSSCTTWECWCSMALLSNSGLCFIQYPRRAILHMQSAID